MTETLARGKFDMVETHTDFIEDFIVSPRDALLNCLSSKYHFNPDHGCAYYYLRSVFSKHPELKDIILEQLVKLGTSLLNELINTEGISETKILTCKHLSRTMHSVQYVLLTISSFARDCNHDQIQSLEDTKSRFKILVGDAFT